MANWFYAVCWLQYTGNGCLSITMLRRIQKLSQGAWKNADIKKWYLLWRMKGGPHIFDITKLPTRSFQPYQCHQNKTSNERIYQRYEQCFKYFNNNSIGEFIRECSYVFETFLKATKVLLLLVYKMVFSDVMYMLELKPFDKSPKGFYAFSFRWGIIPLLWFTNLHEWNR